MSRRFFNPGINLLCCEYWLLKYWELPNLAAPFWRVYHNDEPGAEVFFHDRTYALSPENIYLMAPETVSQAHLTAPIRHLFVHFTAQFPYDCPTPGIFSFPLTSPEREIIAALKADLSSGRDASTYRSMQSLALCMLALTRVPEDSLEMPIEDKRVLKTVKYIQTHFSEKISNHDLAGIAAMNVNAFIRLFKQNISLAPQQFLTEFRLRQACLLLQYSDDTIDEIAEKTGFCNRFYFSKMFSQGRGTSPVRFRLLANTRYGRGANNSRRIERGIGVQRELIRD